MTIKDLFKELIVGFAILPMLIAGKVSATYSVHTIGAYFGSEYQVSVLPQGALSTIYGDTEKSVFSSIGNPVFYWDSENKAHLITPGFFDLPGDMGNYNFYRLCDEISDSNFTDITNCSDRISYDNSFVSSFLSSIGNNDNWAFELYNGSNDYYHFNICFSSKSYHQSLCFFYRANQGYNGWGYQGDEFTCTSRECGTNPRYDFSSIPLEIIGNSPGVGASVPVVPDYDFNEDDDYTNQQIIEGYNAMGLTDEFCYGGFALDNIFEAGSVPQDFTGYMWGSGAFIFDIWDIYSGAYNNNYISFLRSFYISYENNNYSDFYGKTKGLYGFINQWFSVSSKGLGFLESTVPTFTLVDVWQYCDIRFNQNPDSLYTGNRRDPKYRYYTSGQVNLGGYFNFSGNNNYFSGNLSGFNTPKDFFASLNAIFQGGLDNLDNREPVLPTYIIVFFLAIILIRIISH